MLLYLWKNQVELERGRLEIKKELPSGTVEKESGGFEYTHSVAWGFIDLRFEWSLTAQTGSYRLVEKAYVPFWLFVLTALSAFFVVLSAWVSSFVTGVAGLAAFAWTFVSLIVFGLLVVLQLEFESPVEELFNQGRDRRQFFPIASYLLVFLLLVLVFVLTGGWLRDSVIFAVIAVSTGYVVFHDRVVRYSFRWQSWMLDRSSRIPLIVGNYVAGILLFSGIQLLYLILTLNPFFAALLRGFRVGFPILYAGAIAVSVAGFRQALSRGQRGESARFERYGQPDFNSGVYRVSAVVAVVASLGFLVLSVVFVSTAADFVSRVGTAGAYLVTVVSGASILYYFFGVLYQAVNFLAATSLLVLGSEELSLDMEIGCGVRSVDSAGCFAGAVDLVFTRFVVVSTDLLNELDEDELEAVIRHEEAHFRYGDARTGFLAGLSAPLLYTGRNVLFGVLNFRDREFRADRYAASQVGEETVIDALNRLNDLSYENESVSIPGFTPTVTNFSAEEPQKLLEKVFGFYFGNFAQSEAHPSISERKRTLRSD